MRLKKIKNIEVWQITVFHKSKFHVPVLFLMIKLANQRKKYNSVMVKPPGTATSLQWPLFWQIAHKLYSDYCLNLSITPTFFGPQGGCCGGVQLYCKIH